MRVLLTDRAAGKTTEVMRWVAQGERTQGYPGWSRVVVVASMRELERVRAQWWSKIEDIDHRVYDFATWEGACGISPQTEVVFDNLDMTPILRRATLGDLVGFSLTGELWTPRHVD